MSASSFTSVMLALALSFPAWADVTGMVVAVADGDTLTVLVDRTQLRVRLLEIDAPEAHQAFGDRSKQSLSDMCFNKTARLEGSTKDRYGRTLARVYCDGVDANTEQVRRGMAWVYDRYVTEKSLYPLQADAKSARLGLWADNAPFPPWEWRKEHR